jgi:hypothetical protein
MSESCKRADCDIAHDMPCEMGVRDHRQCQYYSGGAEATTAVKPTPESADDGSGFRMPWTGRGLGLADLTLASSRGPACLVGLIGPFNAGKTSLLTSIYLHFAQTGLVGSHGFAGSFTLPAWNQLKDHTQWPSTNGGMFPPHTHDSGQRTPSLLHLAFRRQSEIVRDVLFTDAPGEWFTRWLSNETAANAEGARWIADNATHFIYVVDRAGLASPQVGFVRHNTLALARRLSEHRLGRPVIAVWTKSDDRCDEEVETGVRQRLIELFGVHPSINLHVNDPECVKLLEMVLQTPPNLERPKVVFSPASAFLAYKVAT